MKQKDNLYKEFHALNINDPNYENLKTRYKNYEKNLKTLINIVKKDYYNTQFIKFNSDIKNTWQTIKAVLNKNRSTRKMQTKFCVNGNLIEGDLKIANRTKISIGNKASRSKFTDPIFSFCRNR